MYGWNRQSSEDPAQLRRDLEQERWERERAEDQLRQIEELREQEREQRRAEWRDRIEYDSRTASTWPEALARQESLCAVEAATDDDEMGWFFTAQVYACRRALEIWPEESVRVQPQIDELERQLEQLRKSIALAVADRLEQEHVDDDDPKHDVGQVVSVLRGMEEDTGKLSAWLDW